MCRKLVRRQTGALFLGVSALLGLGACAGRIPSGDTVSAAVPPGAAALYARLCANCHGPDLNGGMASSLVDGDWQYGDTDGDLYASIAKGLELAGMPSFREGLSPAQIQGLVAFMRRAN